MFWKISCTLIFFYLIVVSVVYISQRKLLYHPDENNYLDKENLSHSIEEVKIESDTSLNGWFHFKNKNFKTLLFFHGNAGNLNNRIYKLNDISKLKLNYLIVAYRGFNGNKGNPTEIGLYRDALSAKKWLNQKGYDDKSIILYGESLGTAISIDLASKYYFSGVILESPFTSMTELAKKYYPYLPVSILLKDKYDSINKIKKMKNPILVMHGRKDDIVPFYMGKRIFDEYLGKKYSFFNDYDDHMMEFNSELNISLENFINSLN